jgi:hypothetical protein
MRPVFKIAGALCAAILVGVAFWWLQSSSNHRQSAAPIDVESPGSQQTSEASPVGQPKSESRVNASSATGPKQNARQWVDESPERIRPFLKHEGAVSYAEQVARLRAISGPLTDEEVAAIRRYLKEPSTAASDPEGENWLRNVMLDKLVAQSTAPEDVASFLIGLYEDRSQDVVVRDYSVQHLGLLFDRVDRFEQSSIQSALWHAIDESDSSIGGTALLSLLDLLEAGRPIDRGQLAEHASRLMMDDRCGELTRITAVQVCGRLRLESTYPTLLQLAQTAPSVSLQIAAIAALGEFSTPGTGPILEHLSQSSDPRIANAAQSASNRLTRAGGAGS